MGEWTCPRCRQSFVQKNASHSCDRQTVASFFAGYPRPRALFRAVREAVKAIGPAEIAATKSQISFKARTRFAWAWLPQRWLRSAPEDALVLTFDLAREVRSPKIKEAVEVRPGRWTHHVVLRDEEQLDGEVLGWLRESYAMGRATRRGTPSGAPRRRASSS